MHQRSPGLHSISFSRRECYYYNAKSTKYFCRQRSVSFLWIECPDGLGDCSWLWLLTFVFSSIFQFFFATFPESRNGQSIRRLVVCCFFSFSWSTFAPPRKNLSCTLLLATDHFIVTAYPWPRAQLWAADSRSSRLSYSSYGGGIMPRVRILSVISESCYSVYSF